MIECEMCHGWCDDTSCHVHCSFGALFRFVKCFSAFWNESEARSRVYKSISTCIRKIEFDLRIGLHSKYLNQLPQKQSLFVRFCLQKTVRWQNKKWVQWLIRFGNPNAIYKSELNGVTRGHGHGHIFYI